MGGTTSSVSGAGSTDDEGDPSASTGCSITSTAWGVSAAIGAAGFVSSGPPSGNFVASSFDPVPEGISSGSNELAFSSVFICDGLRPLHSCCPPHDHAAQCVPPVGDNQN